VQEQRIFERINDLAEEEEQLYARAGDGGGLDGADRDRLARINVELDQCYDVLAQRRARRAAGLDPNAVEPRPPDIVERYQQ
jgi:hypothetical protein